MQAFDRGGKGYITEEELADILQRALGMPQLDVHRLFLQIDSNRDGNINFGEDRRARLRNQFTQWSSNQKQSSGCQFPPALLF